MTKVYLSALGIACTLGRGKQEVAKNLFRHNSNPIKSEWLLGSKKTVPVGKVPFELPALPDTLLSLNSRNNRLLKVVLDEIKDPIEASIAKYGPARIGIIMATSTSGMFEEEQAFIEKHQTGNIPAQYHYSQSEISSPSIFASQYLGIQGPAYTISTACSSSGNAICSAKRLLKAGICDAVIVGGVDTLCDLTLNGFDSLELLSEKICNPFSKNRNGITIGEGAAVFLATREGTSADIELSGCGESSDAYQICCPEPEGLGAKIAINNAIRDAGLKPDEISYINLHGTGTTLNDSMESVCINRIFGDKLPCSSTKTLTGHTLGASGTIEAAFLWLALSHEEHGKIPLPPHFNDCVADTHLPKIRLTGIGEFASPINGAFAVMSNSFAFGGSNVSVILKKLSQVNFNITELLPHNPPMVLIDHVVSYQNDFVHCQVTIHPNSPFCKNGAVPSYIGIEYMAQAAAAWNGLMTRHTGEKPKIGLFLGTRRMELYTPSFNIGDVLDVYAKVVYIDGEMGSFECWIDLKNIRAAHAKLNVYQPKNNNIFPGVADGE